MKFEYLISAEVIKHEVISPFMAVTLLVDHATMLLAEHRNDVVSVSIKGQALHCQTPIL